MTINTGQNKSHASNDRGAMKSTPIATAGSVSSVKPSAEQQGTGLSQALIAKRAYEIWLSQGQQPGCDQKNWFQAELQLQRA